LRIFIQNWLRAEIGEQKKVREGKQVGKELVGFSVLGR
jgi:hypothetical protein